VVDIILKNGNIISGVRFEGEDGYYDNVMDRYYRENIVSWLDKREERYVLTKEELDSAITEAMKFVLKVESECKS
jgi:hypothetical protein